MFKNWLTHSLMCQKWTFLKNRICIALTNATIIMTIWSFCNCIYVNKIEFCMKFKTCQLFDQFYPNKRKLNEKENEKFLLFCLHVVWVLSSLKLMCSYLLPMKYSHNRLTSNDDSILLTSYPCQILWPLKDSNFKQEHKC